MTNTIPPEMKKRYEEAKELIENSENIKIYSHTDCDGISSGAILSSILDRLGKKYEIEIVNLDVLENVPIEHELTIFSDLGSGQPVDKNANNDSKILILDHHPPLRNTEYGNTVDYNTYLEINPIHYDIDGSQEICGGGLCYFLAKEFGFKDLSWIGILAAIGDIQNGKTGRLEGLNRTILKDAEEEGLIKIIENDLSLYGRQTRPLFVALSYFSDAKIFYHDGEAKKNEIIDLLKKLKIERHNPANNMVIRICDLSQEDKIKLIKELNMRIRNNVPDRYKKYAIRLIMGESYEFINEEKYTFLRDASEFSTAMNACVRNNRPEVALKLLELTIKRNKYLMSDTIDQLIDMDSERAVVLDKLAEISKDHRSYLAQNIKSIGESDSIIQKDNLQYFDGEGIRSNVVGTIAGMILSYGDWRKPIIAFAPVSEESENLKISLRCSKLLAYDGIHFGSIIREVAQSLGGNGGGHDVACGAYIHKDKKDEFLNLMNEKLDGKLAIE